MKNGLVLQMLLIATIGSVMACSSAPKAWDESAPIDTQAAAYIQDKNGDDFKDVKKIIIPYFQMEFVVKSAASASAFGDDGGSATVAQLFELKGVTDEQLQTMTDRYYENLVAQLKAQGHQVVPHSELVKMKSFQAFEKFHKPTPHLEERNSSTSKFFSYKGMPMYFVDGDKRLSVTGALGSAFSFGKRPAALEEDLEEESGAKVLRARYVVDFVSQAGSTSGGTASMDSSYQVAMAPEFTSVTVPSEGILIHLKAPLFTTSTTWVKSVNEMNAVSNRAISGVTALLGNTRSTREYIIETEPPVWETSVSKMVDVTQQMFFSKMK